MGRSALSFWIVASGSFLSSKHSRKGVCLQLQLLRSANTDRQVYQCIPLPQSSAGSGNAADHYETSSSPRLKGYSVVVRSDPRPSLVSITYTHCPLCSQDDTFALFEFTREKHEKGLNLQKEQKHIVRRWQTLLESKLGVLG